MAKYCLNCGKKLAGQDAQSSVKNFQFLPENRKKVAVIFADVSGFTALSEKMDPEEVREIINACFDFITKPVYELEGIIDKYIGDCVMILFGAKYPHSDDSMRAVICAMKMMELISLFSKERLHSKGVSLSLSIGINYGLVVTGSVGNYFDKDYTVIGDTVNTAQRLQAAAGKGELLVSHSVYVETKDSVCYSNMREISVKNKEKPVKCYIPMNLLKAYGKGNNELIERDKETNLINSIFADSKGSKVIAVIGEPGVGKTSLVKNFISSLNSNVKTIWIDCDHIYQKRVYYLISSFLYEAANIGRETGSSIKKARLMSYIEYILREHSKEEIQRNYGFLSLIMGLDRSKDFQNILNSMKYDDIKREIINQLSIFSAGLCKEKGIVFVVDGIQYADSESVIILGQMLKKLADVKITLVFNSTCEPELFNSFEAGRIYSLKLDRLSRDRVCSQMRSLLGCNQIDKNLLDNVYKYTNGNPLYVKEFTNAIRREGSCIVEGGTAYLKAQEAISLPDSIESIILSNLSGLDEVSTRFLQAASVIGKEFSLSWVKSILGIDADESEVLKMPMQLNIISLKSVYTSSGMVDSTYVFERDTVREVIYNSILNKNKKQFHEKLGEMIESKYNRELEYYYEILCMHYEAAGLDKKAGDYYQKTALKQKNNFNYSSALEYYIKYLQLLNTYSEEENGQNLLHTYMEIGNIYSLLMEYDKALEYLARALEKADLSDDVYTIKLMQVKVYFDKAMYNDALEIVKSIEYKIRQNSNIYGKMLQLKCSILRMQGNSEAFGIAEKSEEILLRNKDFENLSETMSQTGILYLIKGDMENGIYYFNKAYDYAERINNLRVMSTASNNLGIAYHTAGMISKAQDNFNKSIEFSKKTSHIQNYIANNINLGILYMDKGLFDRAGHLFLEALEKAEQVESLHRMCIVQLNLGDLNYETGDFAKALLYYRKSLEIAEDRGMSVEVAINNMGIARIDLKTGAAGNVIKILENALTIFEEAEEVSYISDYYRYRSIYEFQKNKIDEARELCEMSVSFAVKANNDMKKLKALRLKGNILTQRGAFEEALNCYDESINLAVQLESDYETAKGHYRKYEAFHKLNRHKAAGNSLTLAKEATDRIDICRWTVIIAAAYNKN